jgi:hypothetical protein
MGLLEDALRDSFAAQVAAPPAVDDAAGRAIQAAGRVRRRRAVLTSAAVVVAVTITATGAGLLRGSGPSTPEWGAAGPPASSASPVPKGLATDVLVGQDILTTDGRTIALTGLPTAVRAWHVDSGWVVQTDAAQAPKAALWLVAGAGAAPGKIVEGDAVVLSTDGVRVAWASGGKLTVATRSGQNLTDRYTTPGIGGFLPVGFAAGGVVLHDPAQGVFDMWFPARGNYRVGPKAPHQILATTAAGDQLIAFAGASEPCLVLIKPDGMTTQKTACDVKLGDHAIAAPSPDGRWLALAFPDRLDLYDLSTVWTLQQPARTWTITGPTGVAWLDSGSLAVGTLASEIHLFVDQPYRADEVVVRQTDNGVLPIPVAMEGIR